MDLLNFSEAEIEEQLSALGYNNIPKQRLQEFKKDLDALIRQERSKSQSPSDWSSTRSRGDDSRSPPAFTKEKVQLNAPELNNVFTQPPPERRQRQILTSTFTEGQHSFDMPSRGHVDSYAQYSVMPKYTRPATAPCTRQMPPAELELEPEPEPSQSSNTFSDTSPERDTDTRPRGKPSIKRKVLRMYKNNTRDTDSGENSDTSGSSFWSDHEDDEEEEDVPRYPAAEESEEEVIERCVSEQPGGTRQDKPVELLLHTSQTQGRQKGTGSTDRRDETTAGKHNVLKESPGTGQPKLGQLGKCVRTRDQDPTRRRGAEQSGESANTEDEDEESGAERSDDDDDDSDEDEAEMSTSDFEDQAEESGEDNSKSSDEKDSKSTGDESSKTSASGESSQLSSDGAISKSSAEEEQKEEENSRSSAEGVSKSSNEEETGGDEDRSSTGNSKSSGEESTKSSPGKESSKSFNKDGSKLSDMESRRSSGKESGKSSGREGSKSSREGSVKPSNRVSKSSAEEIGKLSGSKRSLGKESGKASGEDGSKKSSGRESSKSLSKESIKSSGKESSKSPSDSGSKSSSEQSSKASDKESKKSSSEDGGKSSDGAEMATGDSEELTETGEDGSLASSDSNSKSSGEGVSGSSSSDDAEMKGDKRTDTDEHFSKSSDEAEVKADGEEQTENSEDQNKSSDDNQSRCSIETVMRRARKRQTESDEDQRTSGADVKESSEEDQRSISKEEKQKANTQLHHITGDMQTVEKKFLPPSDSEEDDDNSTGAAFWSDDETSKAENEEEGAYAQDVQYHHPVEDSEDEVLERFERLDDSYGDKSHQFEEQEKAAESIDNQTLDRQQSRDLIDTANKESFGEHGVLEESASGAPQDNPNQLEKHAMSRKHDPTTQSQAREQSDRPIIAEAASKHVASAEKVKSADADEAPTQKHWYDKENIRILMEEAQQSERDMELVDYPVAFSPTTSVMTSGYGTYRPDSPRETTTDGDPYQDDFSSLADPEEDDSSDVGHFDAQYYADNYRLSVMKDEEFTSNLMLRDDIGSIRNLAGSQTVADHANNSSTDVDRKYVGLDTVSEGVGIESNADDANQIDKVIDEEESQYSDDEVSELRRPYSRKAHTTFPRGADVPARERNGFASLHENYDHPFNLRRNKWKYYQKRKLKGTAYTRRRTKHKRSAVSGLEECLDRLQMSDMHRRHRGMQLESEEMESLSSDRELPSAYRHYFKGMVRSHSENDIRPRPKSVIIPMDHPHTRNLKKTDPVSKYFQYKEEWDAFKAPGEKDHRALRLEIREQLAYQPLPLRPRKALIPNTYVVPTDKRRDALRWEIRHDLAHGIIPTKMAFR